MTVSPPVLPRPSRAAPWRRVGVALLVAIPLHIPVLLGLGGLLVLLEPPDRDLGPRRTSLLLVAPAPRERPRDPEPEEEPPPDDPEGQVIEIAPPETPEAPDVADYLAEVDSSVLEETRVEQTVVNPEVLAPTFSEEQTYEQEDRMELNVEDPSTGATPGSEAFDPARDGNLASVVSQWQVTNKDGVQDPVPASHLQAALSGAPQNDKLDAKIGDEVAVNAKEFVYAGYINRIKRLVNYYWKQNVDNLPPATRLVKPSYRTVVSVVLTDTGGLEAVTVTEASGSDAMDDCVTRAFHLAGPFPNPPAGLIDDDRKVRLGNMGFTVRLGRAAPEFQGVDPRAGVMYPGMLKSAR